MTHQGAANVRRRPGGRAPLPPLKYENLVDEEVKGVDAYGNVQVEQDEEDVGMFGRFFGGLRSAMDAAFGWCSDREDEEIMDIERVSAESLLRFKAQFIQNYRQRSNG